MAAITDLLTNVGQAGTLTSLQAPGKAVGATSITIGSGTNWPTTTAVYFAIRAFSATLVTTANPGGVVAGSYTEWKGVLVGTTISNLTLQTGTDQIYTAGINTQVFIPVTPSRENAIVSWGTAHADQLGNLLPAAVQTAIGAGGITATNLATNAVQASQIATSAITLGYAQTTAVASSGLQTASLVAGLTVTVTIPSGGRRIKVTMYTPVFYNGNGATGGGNITLTLWDGAVSSGTQVQSATNVAAINTGGPITMLFCPLTALSAGSKTYSVGIQSSGSGVNAVSSPTANNPSFLLVEAI